MKFLFLILFLILLSIAGYFTYLNRLLYKVTVERNVLQDHRSDRHMEHLKRHQRILNGYFKAKGLVDVKDTTFWLGGYE